MDVDEFMSTILKQKNNENYDQIIEIVNLLNDHDNELSDTRRADFFSTLLTCIEHVDNYAYDMLLILTDITLIEILFMKLDYKIHRSLNSVLSRIKDFSILRYLVTHPYAKFRVGYKQSEPLRFAVLNNELQRLNILLSGKRVDIHAKGMTTNNKSVVELAVMFNNKKAIKMFLERGYMCTNDEYSNFVNDYINSVECEWSIEKIQLISFLNDSYMQNGMLEFNYMLRLMENNSEPLKELSTVATLRFNFDKIRKIR